MELIYQPFTLRCNTNVGFLGLLTMPNRSSTSSNTILGKSRKLFFFPESGQNLPLMGENQGSIIWLGMSSRILQTTVQVHFRQYQSDFCIMVTLCYPGNHFTAFLKIFLGYNQQFDFFSFRVKQKIGKKRRIKRFKNSRDSLRFFRHCEIF